MIDPSGVYEVGGTPFHVVPRGDTWMIEFPGAPTGFEPGLTRLDEERFRIERGPFDRAVLTLTEGREAIGPLPLEVVPGPYREPVGYGLLPPDPIIDPERDESFQALLDATPPGGRLQVPEPHPIHAFVQWAMDLDHFIFHGSNRRDIEEFQPIRTSIELMDHGERGNLGAVYGTHDGLWAMFFAVIDRNRLRGSIRNGVSRWQAPDGRTKDTYQFSIHHECLPDRPYTDGALYLLARDTFERLPFYAGGPPSDEWASPVPVRARAWIAVEPDDFPFLERLAGHDDGPLLEMAVLARQMLAGATAWDHGERGISVDLDWSSDIEATYVAWRAKLEQFMPGVDVWLDHRGASRTLRIRGPEAYERTIADFVRSVLAGESEPDAPAGP